MIQAMTPPTSTKESIKKLKTAIFASALSAGLILLIFLVRDTTVSSFTQAFETILCAFTLGAIGAIIYIWLAAKFSILGKVTRTNLTATLKALIIVIPVTTILSLVGIALHAPHDAQVWIYLGILSSCIISDAANASSARR